MSDDRPFISRAGQKLEAALNAFDLSPAELICADLGSNVGGFVDCLLRRGAEKVYAIEKGYGVVNYRLRSDPRVVVKERADARLISLPELVDLVTIDVGWTPQREILPSAIRLLKPSGRIISLIKPHYEAAQEDLVDGVLRPDRLENTLNKVRSEIAALGLTVLNEINSPITGHGGNVEHLWLIRSEAK